MIKVSETSTMFVMDISLNRFSRSERLLGSIAIFSHGRASNFYYLPLTHIVINNLCCCVCFLDWCLLLADKNWSFFFWCSFQTHGFVWQGVARGFQQDKDWSPLTDLHRSQTFSQNRKLRNLRLFMIEDAFPDSPTWKLIQTFRLYFLFPRFIHRSIWRSRVLRISSEVHCASEHACRCTCACVG